MNKSAKPANDQPVEPLPSVKVLVAIPGHLYQMLKNEAAGKSVQSVLLTIAQKHFKDKTPLPQRGGYRRNKAADE